MKPTLTEADFQLVASALEVPVPAIKAVAEVESRGAGFLPSGEPKILFEAHIFDRLTGGKYRSTHPNISSKRWDKALYGPPGAHQHTRLHRAVLLDREAALQSASWGKFQIMGFNWKLCGYANVQKFVNDMMESEGAHLRAFARYVVSRGLVDELQRQDWAGFAFGYNGPGFAQNHYDTKLAAAYKRHGGV